MLLNAIHVACFATETASRVTHRSDDDSRCGGGFFGGFSDDGGSDDHGGLKHQGGFDHHGERGDHRGPFAVLQAPVSYYITLNRNSSPWSLLFFEQDD